MTNRPPLIEHDPDEPPRDTSKSHWVALSIVLAFIWTVTLMNEGIDWLSAGVGALTSGIFVLWAIDITGNKVPNSWRRNGSSGGGSR